jgi:hypothetical protein
MRRFLFFVQWTSETHIYLSKCVTGIRILGNNKLPRSLAIARIDPFNVSNARLGCREVGELIRWETISVWWAVTTWSYGRFYINVTSVIPLSSMQNHYFKN